MSSDRIKILVMAAGTGGHVFPALSIANLLMSQSIQVEWLGTPKGMENELLADTGIPLHKISVSGLRGSGFVRKFLAPFMLFKAFFQSLLVILKVRPTFLLGMGGFVSGPAGVAAKILGKPLFIHEQNAVAGLTNRLLSNLADQVFEAYPDTFARSVKAIFTGNPLRTKILRVKKNFDGKNESVLRLLVLGGSQGALSINSVIPEFFSNNGVNEDVHLLHQTGHESFVKTVEKYKSQGISFGERCRVLPFIEEVAEAYAWADLVISRSGASTVSELAAIGLPSILIPYPYHSDNQQLLNAKWLVDEKAAILIRQADFNVQRLKEMVRPFIKDKSQLQDMALNARRVGVRDAAQKIVQLCVEASHG